ncbi:GAF domain-containing sensor histidine kinase [Natronoglycomyces albus]|uniref:Oxygen sensor histidine kinase NreB n=2 Tax=Natronoglycomyces albus TaxID=2811108 RepID=A0A895XUI9_9ACTN|nr:GAF domain-containing sensor histidine kinase [Natronoglycomyces albus]
MRVLHEVSQAVAAINRNLSAAEVMTVIAQSARQLVGADYAAVGIPDDFGGFAEFITDGIGDKQRLAIGPLPRQHGLLAAMLSQRQPVRLDDIRRDPRFEYFPKAHPVMAAFLGVPIFGGEDEEENIGLVVVANDSGKPGFSEDDAERLTLLALHAGIALRNARLYERSRELSIVEERNRLARDLHDAVSQRLFSLRLTSQAAESLVESDPERARALMGQVSQLAREAVAELRAVIVELRPADLDREGLLECLRRQIELVSQSHPAHIEVEVSGESRLEKNQEVDVLRIVREALHNALRHAHAERILVTAHATEVLRVEISDDGVGFDPSEAATRGMGVLSMTDRASTIGGRLHIQSSPGRGTRLSLEIPNE